MVDEHLSDGPSLNRKTSDAVNKLYNWLVTQAWPVWIEYGVDWRLLGFNEHLHLGTFRCTSEIRRLRVLARQVYSFSKAAVHGLPRASEAVEMGVRNLQNARGGDGGHGRVFSLDNRTVDYDRDLYDHAFVLLAFSAASAVLDFSTLRREALLTAGFIEQHLRHPTEGFRERVGDSYPRRQNPHMHLFEASIAAFEAFHDDVFLQLATRIFSLFFRKLFNHPVGALPEYFDDNLAPIYVSDRFSVEPGHHYEWYWLLEQYLGCLNRSPTPEEEATTKQLLVFANVHGLDPVTGLVFDEVDCLGGLRSGSFRLWPQAERVKYEVRRPVHEDGEAATRISKIWTFIDGAPRGLWHERLTESAAAVDAAAPASSLYHLTCAICDASSVVGAVRITSKGAAGN